MATRECYIILALCSSIYAAVLPDNPFQINLDEEVPSTTFRNSKDILVVEDEGANNVEEDLTGLPTRAPSDNDDLSSGFPTFPDINAQPTPEPPKPIEPPLPLFQWAFRPKHPGVIVTAGEAVREALQENKEVIDLKIKAVTDFWKSLQEMTRRFVQSTVTIGNTIPRVAQKLSEKMNAEENTVNL